MACVVAQRAFHAFGVIVRDRGYLVGRSEGSVKVVAVKECRGRDAHRRAVAVAFIGYGHVEVNPPAKESAVTAPRIAAAPLLHCSRGREVVQQNISHWRRCTPYHP